MSLANALTTLIRKDNDLPPAPDPIFANVDAKLLDSFLHQLKVETDIHPAFRNDLLEMLSQAIALANEVSRPSFDFDAIMSHYTTMQAVSSRILSHAVKSRPRINGYGLTHVHTVLPFFAMSIDEAERMRSGMGSLPLNVVGVEVIHRSGFRPQAPAEPVASIAPPPPEPVVSAPEPPAPAPAPPPAVAAVEATKT